MMPKEKRASWFKMFRHQRPVIESVSDADAGAGLKLAFRYFDGENIEETDNSDISASAFTVFCVIRPYIDEAISDYEQRRQDGKTGAEKRWNDT